MVARRFRAGLLCVTAACLAACNDDATKEAEAAAERAASSANQAPSISGSPPRQAFAGEIYSFAPTAIDPDGDPMVFGVDGLPKWLQFDNKTGGLSGTPKDSDVGEYRGIVVRVSDGRTDSLLPALDISVLPPRRRDNQAPVVSGTPMDTVIVGSAYDFLPVASDADGDRLSFEIENRPAWAIFDAEIGRLSGTPDNGAIGTYAGIVIRVSDRFASAEIGPFAIAVNPLPTVNRAPVISGTPASAVLVGQAWSFQPQAADPDGDPLSFQVAGAPAWMTLNYLTGFLGGTPGVADVGRHAGIQLIATDGEASAVLAPFTVDVISPNGGPAIDGVTQFSIPKGQPFSFTPTASDPEGDPLTFTVTGLPVWATFEAQTGRLAGTPGSSGTFSNIVISVSDGREAVSLAPFSIVVFNSPPELSGTPGDSIAPGIAYSFTPTASDPNGDALTFTAEGVPPWASFDPATGQLSGVAEVAGTYSNIVITAQDAEAASASLPAFSITVSSRNFPPVISGSPSVSALNGQIYSFTPTASDPNGDALSFTVSGLPAWASFDGTTGQLSGVPTTLGTWSGIVITASDGQASASLPPFSIEVASQNRAPAIGGAPQTSIPKGQPFSFTPTASDPEGDSLTFTVAGLPAWATFNGITGRLAGTPAASGTYPGIVITVSDGEESASLPPFALVVFNSPPQIGGTAPTSITQGQTYNFTPTASDPNGDAVSFSASGVPSWASFNPATGQLSGVAAGAGTYSSIEITAHDGEASASLPAFSITVSVLNLPPVISGSPSGSVPRGQFYSFTPTASDPNGDALSFTVSALPGWASFNGTTGHLSGVPATLGTWSNIVIEASDGQASAALPAFSIAVVNLPPVISGAPADTVLVDSWYQFVPSANDPDGDALTFSIAGLPAWAIFNAATGAVSGTPTASHVGDYGGIAIAASDGTTSATLGPFSIRVQGLATGTALLSWMVPTQNTDGTPLSDLAGYVVYWGTSSRNYPNSFRLTNPSASSFVVENLLAGRTYYFALTAYNTSGAESDYSNEASKQLP